MDKIFKRKKTKKINHKIHIHRIQKLKKFKEPLKFIQPKFAKSINNSQKSINIYLLQFETKNT